MTDKMNKTLRDSAAMRWLVMLLISGLMFATYYFQDFYAGLKDLMESEFGFTSEQFGRIIGLTTIANVVGMIIVGGIILDKFGIRVAGFMFGGLAAMGGLVSALTASGVIFSGNPLLGLIIGRILFGIGLEVVCVIVMRAIVKWFKGYEVALAMGINMGFGRLGSALAIAISLDIAGGVVSPAVTFAATLIGIAMIMFTIYTFLDYKIDKQDKKIAGASDTKAEASEDFKFSDLIKLVKNSSFLYITLLCVAFYSAVFPFIQYAPDLLVNKFGFTYVLPLGGDVTLFGSKSIGNAFVYVVVFVFALSFTLIPNNISKGKRLARLIILALFAVIVYINKDLIGIWLQNGPKTAALIPLGTIIFTPIFGSIVDKKGKAASLMMLGALLLIFAHVALSLSSSPIFAYFGLLSLGIAFSLVPAAMWPSVAKIVPENRLGTAYASMFTVQNWGLGLFFWGIGALLIAIPVNKDTKNEIDEYRASFVVVDNEDAFHLFGYIEDKVNQEFSDSINIEKVNLILPDIQKEIYEVFNVRTKEEVTETLQNIREQLLSIAKERNDSEELKKVEDELDGLKESLEKNGKLSGGEISQLVKLMQANDILKYYDYKIPILVLVFCGLISIFLAFKLKRADKKQGFGLELPNVKK
ncbi:MAG: MFS transporter [Bacteroidetes bacterium]|nr:MFS transporter [Bacteroidota bacterium]